MQRESVARAAEHRIVTEFFNFIRLEGAPRHDWLVGRSSESVPESVGVGVPVS
jgi:hypothetical protein